MDEQPVVVPDALDDPPHRSRRRPPRWLLALAAAVVLAVSVGLLLASDRDDGPAIALDVVSDAEAVSVYDGMTELCRDAVPRFRQAFVEYRSRILELGADTALIDERTELIASIRSVTSRWPPVFQDLIADDLATATTENDRARARLGGTGDLIRFHHESSQAALVRFLSRDDLPGSRNCNASLVAWRPGGG